MTYTISNGTCQNPGGEWNTFWCYVDQVRSRIAGLKSQAVELSWAYTGPSIALLLLWMRCCLCTHFPVTDPRLSQAFHKRATTCSSSSGTSCLLHLY